MDKIFNGSLFTQLGTIKGVTTFAIAILVVLALVILVKIYHVNLLNIFSTIGKKIIGIAAKSINKRELRYHRDIAIGKINEKRLRVKTYRFLNDLIIDLGLKSRGANPYEFLLLVIVSSALISLIGCEIVFKSFFMGIIIFPIVFMALICGLYTKANIAHDARIEAIIEAENIISNNIKDGVVVAVRNSLDLMPQIVRTEFRDFLDNVEHKNYHIKTALMELNNNLGSTADDFIKKCIVFEMEEEHGIIGIFQDVVEINNIRTEMRTEMKRKFEQVSSNFIISVLMIFIFLGGTMAIFDVVREFYLRNRIGQLILAIDLLMLVGEFVFITYLRAKEF